MVGIRPDVLQYPTGFTVLRTFQAILSILITCLAAFTVHVMPFAGNCLMLFTTVLNLAVSLWMMLAHISLTHLYNFWVAVALDSFLLLFWAISTIVLAVQTSVLWAVSEEYCKTNKCSGPVANVSRFWGYVFVAAVGLGGVAFLFSFVCLIFHCVMGRRQRRYNRVGINIDSEPVQHFPTHPQGPVDYQNPHAMTGYQSPPRAAGYEPSRNLGEDQPLTTPSRYA
ncbi:hypothetical protein ACJZ2D_015706 [Fusarium nematophilum]